MRALNGVDLGVRYGTVLALLWPNRTGKTTLVRILTTLPAPDAGRARVAGYDVVRGAGALRAVMWGAGQYAAVDQNLTGQENLEMVGRLYQLNPVRQAPLGPCLFKLVLKMLNKSHRPGSADGN